MRRLFAVATFAAAAALPSAVAQPPAGWATVKGQVVFPADAPIPKQAPLQVTQDKAHCLSKGDILDQTLIVNEKNRGIKNVVVWLRPDDKNPKAKLEANQVFPADAQRKPADVEIDQPCCMFTPRITLARVGDTIVVKNSAPVPHNFFWTSANNGNQNPNIPPGGNAKVGPLVAESTPIQYKCSIHPWMSGYVRVFDNPYYAVTDADGKFTLQNAPVGKFRLVAWHEKVGYLGGREGRFGTPIEIKAPETDLPPLTFTELAKQEK